MEGGRRLLIVNPIVRELLNSGVTAEYQVPTSYCLVMKVRKYSKRTLTTKSLRLFRDKVYFAAKSSYIMTRQEGIVTIPKAASAFRASQIIFCGKSPKTGRHVFPQAKIPQA